MLSGSSAEVVQLAEYRLTHDAWDTGVPLDISERSASRLVFSRLRTR